MRVRHRTPLTADQRMLAAAYVPAALAWAYRLSRHRPWLQDEYEGECLYRLVLASHDYRPCRRMAFHNYLEYYMRMADRAVRRRELPRGYRMPRGCRKPPPAPLTLSLPEWGGGLVRRDPGLKAVDDRDEIGFRLRGVTARRRQGAELGVIVGHRERPGLPWDVPPPAPAVRGPDAVARPNGGHEPARTKIPLTDRPAADPARPADVRRQGELQREPPGVGVAADREHSYGHRPASVGRRG